MKVNYLDSVLRQFQYYKLLGDRTFSQLEEKDIFWKQTPESNSIAIIVKHLWGNMRSRWTDFLTSDGEKEWRHRDQEFVEDIQSKKELLAKWEAGWQCLFTALDSVHEDNFDTTIYIRNMGHTIVEAINRQLAHYAYHVGQIVFIGTMIKGNEWKSLSIPKGQSVAYNSAKFSKPKHTEHFTEEFLDGSFYAEEDELTIRNLKGIPLGNIVDCLTTAFEGYFVQMPSDVDYWRTRYQGARVDWELSFGAFHDDQLVGFIINGVDYMEEVLTAFNTGTGVIPEFRGKQIVDRLYAFAFPFFEERGIKKCALEVIQENARAIKVYERIGFSIKRNLLSFKGTLINKPQLAAQIQAVPFQTILSGLSDHSLYSWDFTNEALLLLDDNYTSYLVTNASNQPIGYFILNPSNNMIAQLECSKKDIPTVLNGVRQVTPSIRMVNVDDGRTALIENLVTCGLENTINQFEMEMLL